MDLAKVKSCLLAAIFNFHLKRFSSVSFGTPTNLNGFTHFGIAHAKNPDRH